MTERQRVLRNILATYGRSLYALFLGLFSARWLLQSLGQSDYGLYGVIGGMATFISFFNGLLAGAIARFYAVSIGAASVSKEPAIALEDCRRWFNLALMIHTLIPGVLILIGYPLGVWAIQHWLVIPADRISACIWVFRAVCITCFISMVNVPFQAFYTAKQYIAELTVYSVLSSTFHFLLLMYMINHPCDWLVSYSFAAMLIAVIPQVIIGYRALKSFPECKVNLSYCIDIQRLKTLILFAFWQFFGAIGALARGQAIAILVNKAFGPIYNTSASIANSVAGNANMLSAALHGAFAPVISTSEGAGKHDRMLKMAYRSSAFGSFLCLLFVNPLIIECDTLLQLWLKTPPPAVTEATRIVLLMLVFDQFYTGLDLSVNATGRVAHYNGIVGVAQFLSLPVIIFIIIGCSGSFISIFVVLLVWKIAIGFISLPIAQRVANYSMRTFYLKLLFPALFCMGVTLLLGSGVRLWLAEFYWLRMFCVGITCELVFIPCALFLLFNSEDRSLLSAYCQRYLLLMKG